MGFEELSHAGVIKALLRLLGGQQGLTLLTGSYAMQLMVSSNPMSVEIGLRGVF